MYNELNLQFTEYFSKNQSSNDTKQQLSGKYKTLKEPNDPYSLSKNNSLYDCIIFKVAIATGWNIPRACMIIQLRSLTSQKLKIQTLGRIKRNPLKTLNKNENAMKYYV
jgi:type III restriction enzyme